MALGVCFLIADFLDGGAQRQCALLVNELQAQRNVDISLLYLRDGIHSQLIRRDHIRIIKVPTFSNYDPFNIWRIRNLLLSLDASVLVTWLHACDVYGFFLKHSLPKLRWVMTERDSSYPADPRFILRRYLGRYADAIVANSDKGAHYWREAGALGRVVVTSNIVHPTVPWTDAPDSTRVVAIGRLEPQKNVGAIVRAFVRLAERREDLTFCIIGEGSQRGRLEAIVRNSSGANRIAFLGFRADVAQQIRDATLVVSMSHHEGQPNVILESIAGGRLVVVSDIPEHRELLGPDYPFYVAHRNDPQHIAVVIEAAVRVAADVSPLAHSRERLVRFTPEAVARQYLNLFATVLEDSR